MARGEMKSLAGLPLHAMGDPLQLKYIVKQCEEINQGLDGFISLTKTHSSLRRGDFLLEREPGRNPNAQEAKLKQNLWEKHRRDSPHFLPGVCSFPQSDQVYLHGRKHERPGDEKLKFDWGGIDLLGVSPSGLPVVMELKAGKTDDPPLASLPRCWPTPRPFRSCGRRGVS